MAGHSRNGKLSLLAGAFDERITAVVTSSGGSCAEIPWRSITFSFTSVPFLVQISCVKPIFDY
ncbi:glucuronyl esterase domain-containing protein [Dyadobacter bucti]|uniref:glucuronyl esterase domain-containing protein n=1 Tax=Dyadobacter bucti TaxID=2572203 RepID=UPI0035B68710